MCVHVEVWRCVCGGVYLVSHGCQNFARAHVSIPQKQKNELQYISTTALVARKGSQIQTRHRLWTGRVKAKKSTVPKNGKKGKKKTKKGPNLMSAEDEQQVLPCRQGLLFFLCWFDFYRFCCDSVCFEFVKCYHLLYSAIIQWKEYKTFTYALKFQALSIGYDRQPKAYIAPCVICSCWRGSSPCVPILLLPNPRRWVLSRVLIGWMDG